jgi:hypothetical protein
MPTDEGLEGSMIAFRIRFNNRKLATAGLHGHHVVSAIATSVARRPESFAMRAHGRSSRVTSSSSSAGCGRRPTVRWRACHGPTS